MARIKKSQPAAEQTVTLTCAATGESKQTPLNADGTPKLNGWKHVDGKYYSPDGFASLFVCRAITVPVDRVVIGYKTPFDLPYDDPQYTVNYREFRKALNVSWKQCAQIGNYYMGRLFSMDTQPIKDGKLVPMSFSNDDRNALSRLCRTVFPDIDSQSLYSMTRAAESRYKQARFDIHIRVAKSVPSYRIPTPLPVHNQSSPISLDDKGRVLVRLRIAGQQFVARLKDDEKRFGRQLAPLRRAALGELRRGDLSIRDKGNGQTLITIPVFVPREKTERQDVAMLVRTDPECLIVGEIQGRNIFLLNERHINRWNRKHERFYHSWAAQAVSETGEVLESIELPNLKWLVDHHTDLVQRMGEDSKAERRGKVPYHEGQTRRERRQHHQNMLRALETRCQKHHERIKDAIHKISRVIVNHAVRRKCCLIAWEDSRRTYMPKFPYAALRVLVEQKAIVHGIKVEVLQKDEEEATTE